MGVLVFPSISIGGKETRGKDRDEKDMVYCNSIPTVGGEMYGAQPSRVDHFSVCQANRASVWLKACKGSAIAAH